MAVCYLQKRVSGCRSLSTAVFEDLFDRNGWGQRWRDGIYDYVHYNSSIHEVVGVPRGSGKVQFGGTKGRALTLWQSFRRASAGDTARRIRGLADPITPAIKATATASLRVNTDCPSPVVLSEPLGAV